MGTNQSETLSVYPEDGDSVCLICLQMYNDENKNTDTAKLLYFQNIFDAVSKYLSTDIFASCFQWNFVDEGVSPVCSPCFTYMEKIFKIGQQLNKLQNAIEILIKTFTEQVEAHHNNLQFLYTEKDLEIGPSTSETRNNEDSCGNHRSESLKDEVEVHRNNHELTKSVKSPGLNFTSSKVIALPKISTAGESSGANSAKSSEVIKYQNISLKPLKIVLKRSSAAATSTCVAAANSASNTKPILKSLRIVLKRLQFDSKGNLITAAETPLPLGLKMHYKRADVTGKPKVGRENKSGYKKAIRNKTEENKALRNGYKESNGIDERKTIFSHDEDMNKNCDDEDIYQKLNIISNYHNIAKRFNCQDKTCQLAFNFRKEIEGHSLESGHVNERKHKCKECSKSFFRHMDLKLHTKVHEKIKLWKCKECSKKFSKQILFRRHSYNCHTEKLFKCTDCEERFLWKINYENHSKLHRTKTIECDKCFNNFFLKLSVKNHLCSGSKHENVHRCNLCSKKFINRLSLGRHRLTHFKKRIRKYIECSACKKTHFVERAWDKCIVQYFREGTTHSFTCAICSSVYKTAKALDDHSSKNKHVNKKHFFCFICKKPHYSSRDLKEHLNCHKKGSPVTSFRKRNVFKCRICNEKFRRNYLFDAHMKNHRESGKDISGNISMKISCNICNKKFKYKHNLDDHLNTHTGEKPHKCTLCDKSFYQRSELFRHSKYCTNKYSETESFRCDICDRVYKDDIKYRRHMKVHG